MKQNYSGTAELSETSFGLLVENEQVQSWTMGSAHTHFVRENQWGPPVGTHTHTHMVDATNRALSKGGLNVLSLVRCSIKTKTCSNVALGTFLQCKARRGARQQLPHSQVSLQNRCSKVQGV